MCVNRTNLDSIFALKMLYNLGASGGFPGHLPGALPLHPTEALKWASGPHVVKLERFDFILLRKHFTLAPSENKSPPLATNEIKDKRSIIV